MTLQQAIRAIAGAGTEPYSKICRVDAVDEQARTVDCTPIDESAPLVGVNLQANQGSEDGIVPIPAPESYVVVSFLSADVAVVVLCEKIDKVLVKVGDTSARFEDGQVEIAVGDITASMTGEAVTFNGGEHGGMVIAQSAAEKLNALENDLNAIKAVFSGWTPVPQDGGAALKAAAAAWAGQQLATTVAADLEDEKVTH